MKALVLIVALAVAGAIYYWFAIRPEPHVIVTADPVEQRDATSPARERQLPPARYTPPPATTEIPREVTNFTELNSVLRGAGDCEPAGQVGEWLNNMQERAAQSSLDFAAAFGAQPGTEAYHSYDEATLRQLATAGDSRAAMTLGHRASASGDDEAARDAYRNAAVLGEEDALGFLIYTLGRARDKAERAGDAAAIEQAVVDQLAWHRVQEKRMGVLYFPPTERWSEQYLAEDPALEAEATARGAELYQTLNQERTQRGMDAFEDYPATLSAEQIQASIDCSEQ